MDRQRDLELILKSSTPLVVIETRDFGALYNKYHGETERNAAAVLQVLQSADTANFQVSISPTAASRANYLT